MGQIKGLVRVYEASDGGTGDPTQTFWQFFVEGTAVRTRNHRLADTMRIAVETNSIVAVTYGGDDETISQVRMEFEYVCEAREVGVCDGKQTPLWIDETIRVARYRKPDPPGQL